MQDTERPVTDEYDPRYDSQQVPGLGFNGLLGEIGDFLRKLFKRPAPSRRTH